MLASTDVATCSVFLYFLSDPISYVFIFSCHCFVYFPHIVISSGHLFTLFILRSEQSYSHPCTVQGHFSSVTDVSKWSRQGTDLHNALQKSPCTCPHHCVYNFADFSYIGFTLRSCLMFWFHILS
jgi:hypothetical protein